MEIRLARLDDDAEMHALWTVIDAADRQGNPERPQFAEQIMVGMLREPTPEAKIEPWVALDDDGGLVGGCFVYLPQLDNTDKGYVQVDVAPDHQRRGIGGALVEHAVERARHHGRTCVLAESHIPGDEREDHGYRRFAEAHGFAAASTEVARRLRLPVDRDRLDNWIAEAEPHHAAYRIETFQGDVPDDLLPSLCDVVNQLAIDAPTGDIAFEAEAITPEVRRESSERNRRNGLREMTTVAISPEGTVAAMTSLGIPDDTPGVLYQWATIVAKEHRGHRLGLALKAYNLRAVQLAEPDRTQVWTTNHEDNDFMVSINEAMGFERVELLVEFQRML